MKRLLPWAFTLRDWQNDAFDLVKLYQKCNKTDFLAVATPGAGKTTFALRVAHYFIDNKIVERIVIIVPTDHLKKQMALDSANLGIDLDPYINNGNIFESSEYHGIVLTYQGLSMRADLIKKGCIAKKTLVIIDEIHHAGDSLTWGNSIQHAFAEAGFRLLMSGTPFRSDGNPIPFVKYEDGISKADYTYSYSQAIVDNLCRPVYFYAINGKMKWETDNKTYFHTFEDILDEARSSERLRSALNYDGEWLRHVIIEADNQLNRVRSTHFNAGGLVIAMDQEHAKNIAKVMTGLIGVIPDIAVSEDPEASNKISKFSQSNRKWLVCVKMVSEGVDIPRLRVGVHATNVKSELFFRQEVGRFVRFIKGLPEQNAHIYIPKDANIVNNAERIEIERNHALSKRQGNNIEFELEQERSKKEFKPISAEPTESMQLSFFGDKISKAFSVPVKVAEIIAINSNIKTNDIENNAVFQQRDVLRKDIDNLSRILAKKFAERTGSKIVDWLLPHRNWHAIGGKNIELETNEELKKRKKWLEDQL